MKKHITAALLTILTALTGCSGSDSSSYASLSEKTGTAEASEGTSAANKKDIIITMAVKGEVGSSFQKVIDAFNDEDNGYRIEPKIYMSNYDENGKMITQGHTEEEILAADFEIIQEIINGNDIDIVGNFSLSTPKYHILQNKGAFADLYNFMENDEDINKDTLNPHILDLCESDGGLYSIPTHYNARTMLGKAEYVGAEQNWSIDSFIEHWEQMPPGSLLTYSNEADAVYYDVLRQNAGVFVDYDNYEVHFDSPEFRRLLEFSKQFPYYGEKADYFDNTAPKMLESYNITSVKDSIYDEWDYSSWTHRSVRLKDGEYTLAGFPSLDGNGAFISCAGYEFSICKSSSSEKQKGAWDFIRRFYLPDEQVESSVRSEEYYDDELCENVIYFYPAIGFCINNEARQRAAEKYCNGEFINKIERNGGEKYIPECPDEQDCQFIEDYVNSISRLDLNMDRELFHIVEDEVFACLRGEQDIDTTIENIQNRASLWIGEQA